MYAASPRCGVFKRSPLQARLDDQLHAVIYCNKEEPVLLTLERRVLIKDVANPQFFMQLVDVEVGGAKHRVLPRDVQFHPVSDTPMHVDFLRFGPKRKISANVPVVFEGEDESPGLKSGGVLNIVRYEVEVLCTADNIPPELILQLAGLDVGDSMHASAVTLPTGVEFAITVRDFTVATIAAPTIAVEPAAGEEGEEGEEGEGAEATGDSAEDGGDGDKG